MFQQAGGWERAQAEDVTPFVLLWQNCWQWAGAWILVSDALVSSGLVIKDKQLKESRTSYSM